MQHFALLAALGIVLLAGWICLPFLPAMVWALVIYQVGLPLQRKLQQRYSPRKTALFMLLLVTLTLVIPVTLVGGQLVIEAAGAFQKFEESPPSAEAIQRFLTGLPLPEFLRGYLASYSLDTALASHGAEIGKALLGFVTGLLSSAARNAGAFLFSLAAFLLIYYSACLDGPNWRRALLRAVPASFGLDGLLTRLATGARGLFWGVAGTCLAQGVAGAAIFLILGLPAPLLIGALISFCALIPLVGTALIWLPFSAWLLVNGAWIKALILALYGLLVIGSMDNVTRPLLTRISGAEIPLLTVTLGAIGGLALFGLTGMVLGPLALEAFAWLLDRLGAEHPEMTGKTPDSPS